MDGGFVVAGDGLGSAADRVVLGDVVGISRSEGAFHEEERFFRHAVVAVAIGVVAELLHIVAFGIERLFADLLPGVAAFFLCGGDFFAHFLVLGAGVGGAHESLQSFFRMIAHDELLEFFVDAVLVEVGDVPAGRVGELPAVEGGMVVEGLGEAAGDEVGVFRRIVVVGVPVRREQLFAVDQDVRAVFDGHMPHAVCRHHAGETFDALLHGGMVVVVRRVGIFGGVVVLVDVLRFIGQVVGHARHGGRAAAGVEARRRHEMEAAFVRFHLARQRDVLGDGVADDGVELLPVEVVCRRADGDSCIRFGDGFGVVLRAVLAEAVRHLVAENGGQLVFVVVQGAHEAAVHRDVVGRIAGGVEGFGCGHAPEEGQGVDGERVFAVLRDLAEHAVDDFAVGRVLVLAVLFQVLLQAADLVVDVVADGEHFLERALVGEEAADGGHADHHRVERGRFDRCCMGQLCGAQEAGEDGGAEFLPDLHFDSSSKRVSLRKRRRPGGIFGSPCITKEQSSEDDCLIAYGARYWIRTSDPHNVNVIL